MVAFGLFTLLFVQAQTPKEKFIRYGLLTDEARALADAGLHDAALPLFDSAFALVPFMAGDYVPAVLNALAAGRDDRANALLVQATENGLDIGQVYRPELQAFLQSQRAMTFLNLQEYMKQRWLDHADTGMIRTLSHLGTGQMMVVDQQGAMHWAFDSTAFGRLADMVRDHGVPTAAAVGDAVHAITRLCMDFAGDFPDGERWRPVLPRIQAAMDQGRVPPDLLASVQDQADMLHHRPMTYGELIPMHADAPGHFEMLGQNQVDEARKAVGLGPLDHLLERWGVGPDRVHFQEP